ncbi:hypothetical protein F2Z80_20915 [Vibrio fortis]|uniref:Uncharacterized protein n=1 Tax=Vibrio fortis TaxID=212667 RepID=A0A5N3S6K5_9VIBR|nr:hypothetical protein [Vibrio fortis]KAB0301523.1 hypothetical protein F2Z80_20915 [Vibrio fortis]
MVKVNKSEVSTELNKLFMDVFGDKLRNPVWLAYIIVFIHTNSEQIINILNFSAANYNSLLIENLKNMESVNWGIFWYTVLVYVSIMLAFTIHSSVNIGKKILLSWLGKKEAKARFDIKSEESGGLSYHALQTEHKILKSQYEDEQKKRHNHINQIEIDLQYLDFRINSLNQVFTETYNQTKVNFKSLGEEAKILVMNNIKSDEEAKNSIAKIDEEITKYSTLIDLLQKRNAEHFTTNISGIFEKLSTMKNNNSLS